MTIATIHIAIIKLSRNISQGNLHFNKLGTPFGTFDHAISAYGTIGTEDVKYGLSKGKWEVEFTGIATAANGDMYSVVDGATLAFSVTK